MISNKHSTHMNRRRKKHGSATPTWSAITTKRKSYWRPHKPPPSQSKPQTTTTPIQTSKSEHINIQIPRSAIQNRSPHPPENHMPKKPIKDYKNPEKPTALLFSVTHKNP